MTPAANTSGLDCLTRFLIDRAGVRGVRVHLHETWQQIRARGSDVAAKAPAAMELLGQASAAAALFTGHAKVGGRLSVQLRGDAGLRTLFAECTAAGTLRGIVQLRGHDGAGSIEDAAAIAVSSDLRELGENAVLAITIENPSARGSDPGRYQGLVSLEAESLSAAFEHYFHQSEQLPTRLLLAADDHRAAGLMLQKLPGDSGDDDGWIRACALFDTLTAAELLDLPAETLLVRLFHEDGVQVLGQRPLGFACSCSRERVESMLAALGEDEALAAVADNQAKVRCEFCGQHYLFTLQQVEDLLARRSAEVAAPERLQ